MSKKTEKKHQERVIDDRTFGLKNKNKSKAVQKFIKGVENTVKNHGKSAAFLEQEELEKKKLKKQEEEDAKILSALLQSQKHRRKDQSDDQADPKTIVCPYYKQGICQKGKKCKYSHDLTLDRTEELDLYVDQRTQLIMNAQDKNQMKQWDEDKLMSVIRQKEKVYIKQKPTEIVCKFFLDAVEKGKYGWNWQCQNGVSCHYKHCLPPGYVLKKNLLKASKDEDICVEERIDKERQKLVEEGHKGKLVTLQVFLEWKAKKVLRKQEQAETKKKEEEKKGKAMGKQHYLSGKALFQFDPTLFIDDQDAATGDVLAERVEEEQEQVQEKSQNNFINQDDDQQIEEEKQEEQEEEVQQEKQQRNGTGNSGHSG